MPYPVFRFDKAELRPAARQLLIDGQDAAIGGRAFDLLVVLIENRERMLSKGELLDRVWPKLVVEENNLQVQISTLRKLLGTKAISTIPGRGYRFVAPLVEDVEATAAHPIVVEMPAAAAASDGDRPSVGSGSSGADDPAVFGRDADCLRLTELVQAHRLVSVVGAGGIGKTCLALTALRQLAWAYREQVFVAELAAVSSAPDLPRAVAQALGIQLPATADAHAGVADLAARLPSQPQLLLLDNCEHLTEAVAQLVPALLAASPALHVLATSQEPLHLANEHVLRLGPLPVPAAGESADPARHPAVALFVARVLAQQPAFRLDAPGHAGDVAEIVRRLDGLPLAIELAAARVPLLGVAGVRSHLDERLRVLASGARDLPSRHRTLRATLDWSHALLGAEEQTVFRRLGVFVGGFGLELAQSLAADEHIDAWAVLEHLGTLVDKSMVVAEAGVQPRYHLLESTRAYALAELATRGETGAIKARHARCLRDALQRGARAAMQGQSTIDDWTLTAAPETDNLRSAIEWAAGPGGDRALLLDLVNIAAVLMYQIGRYPECLRWMRLAEPFIDETVPPTKLGLFVQGKALVGLHGGLPTAERLRLLEQAREIYERDGPKAALVMTLCLTSYVQGVSGDFGGAEDSLARAEALLDGGGTDTLRATWLHNMGILRRYQDRPADALDAYRQALPLARAAGNSRLTFYAQNNLAAVHESLGHVDEAIALYRSTLERLRRSPLADGQMITFALLWQAQACIAKAAVPEARALIAEALPHARRSVGLRHFALLLARVAALDRRWRDAALLLGCDEAARERRGEPRHAAEARQAAATLALIERAATPDQVERWRAEGRSLDEDGAQALAVAAG